MHAKPVVVLDPFGTYAGLRAYVETLVEQDFVRPEAVAALHWATSVEEALSWIEVALARTPSAANPTDEELLEFEP